MRPDDRSRLQKNGLSPSPHHAEHIPGEKREWADKDAGVYYYDDLVVLRTARTPAVLVEAGIIVNRIEEQTLQEPAMLSTIATSIAQGLTDCKAISK